MFEIMTTNTTTTTTASINEVVTSIICISIEQKQKQKQRHNKSTRIKTKIITKTNPLFNNSNNNNNNNNTSSYCLISLHLIVLVVVVIYYYYYDDDEIYYWLTIINIALIKTTNRITIPLSSSSGLFLYTVTAFTSSCNNYYQYHIHHPAFIISKSSSISNSCSSSSSSGSVSHVSSSIQRNTVSRLQIKLKSQQTQTQTQSQETHDKTNVNENCKVNVNVNVRVNNSINTDTITTTIISNTTNFIPSVLYESHRILIINKPYGISYHNDIETNELGILNLVRKYYYEKNFNSTYRYNENDYYDTETDSSNSVDDDYIDYNDNNTCTTNTNTNTNITFRLYGVHRLDKVTSGILVFAKDQEMASLLSKMFASTSKASSLLSNNNKNKNTTTSTSTNTFPSITKYYIGISNKKPTKKKQGYITGSMIRGRRKSWYLVSNSNANNSTNVSTTLNTKTKTSINYAKTRFYTAGLGKVISDTTTTTSTSNNSTNTNNKPQTIILFRPFTGKTHQLRVAAKCIGLPLLGDPIYNTQSLLSSSQIQSLSKSSSQSNAQSNESTLYQSQCRTYLHATAIHIPLGLLDKNNTTTTTTTTNNKNEGNITIWCPPTFDTLFVTNPTTPTTLTSTTTSTTSTTLTTTSTTAKLFNDIVVNLFLKYCTNNNNECIELISKIKILQEMKYTIK